MMKRKMNTGIRLLMTGIALAFVLVNFSVVMADTIEPGRDNAMENVSHEESKSSFKLILEKRLEEFKKLKDDFLRDIEQKNKFGNEMVSEEDGVKDSIIILHHDNGGRMPAKAIISKHSELR